MADYIIVCIPFVLAFLGALMSMEATKKHHKKFLFLIILIGIAGSIFNAIEVRESRSERETQKNMLSKIYDTLKPFSEIALAKYPKLNEKQALARLANEIKNLELSTKAQEEKIKHIEYTEVSKYNAGGNKSGGVNNVRFVPTPIDDWNRGYVNFRTDGGIDFKCNDDAIEKCRSVIEKEPLYPFSYYFLAKCLKDKQDSKWREYALKARQIIQETTVIPGHHKHHDEILKDVNGLLNSH